MRSTLISTFAAFCLVGWALTTAAAQEASPEAGKAEATQITLDEQGRCHALGRVLSLDDLGPAMKKWAEENPDRGPVVVRADRGCPLKYVAMAVKVCGEAGIRDIRIASRRESERQRPARPNVLLILVDDLGYGDLSSYGAKDLETPNIDRLTARGMKFTDFYANCPVCSPTRAALLSGCYPDAVGVPGVIRTHSRNSWGYLAPDAVLLPALLKRAGYQTAMVGKWHLGLGEPNLPNLRGFDFFHGFLGDMMDDYRNHRRHGVNYMRVNGETIDPEGHATDLFTQWTCDWLRQYQGDAPFLIYLAYNAPHSPIQPPEDFLERYRAKHPDAAEKRAKLAALVEHMDSGIGQVLAALEATGRAENTLIFFTSDNGGSLPHGASNGPLAGGKQDMLEGGIRVPMCAVWPGKIEPGSRSERVALTMDLLPTICEAAGAQLARPIDGRSILPMLLGKPQPPEDRFLFWVRLEGGRRYQGKPYYAARHGDWKLVENDASEPYRLYNLKNDPKETTDLSASSPEKYEELEEALGAHIARCAEVPWRLPDGTGPGEIGEPQSKQ